MKTLVISTNSVVRAGIRTILHESGREYACEEASGYRDAAPMVRDNHYDVALLGLATYDLADFHTMVHIKQLKRDLPFVVISLPSEERLAVSAYSFGADGYIDGNNTPSDLVSAIEKVVQGGKFISEHLLEEILACLRNRAHSGQEASRTKALSKRENQIAEMLAAGATNKEIAWRLSLSNKTVSTYKTRILRKLNLKNLAGLVKHQLTRGAVDFSAPIDSAPPAMDEITRSRLGAPCSVPCRSPFFPPHD